MHVFSVLADVQAAAAAKTCHAEGVVDAILNTLAQFAMPSDPEATYPRAVVEFGSSLLAREATLTLFGVAAEHADQMRAGWATCLSCVLRLHQLRLVDVSVFSDAQVCACALWVVSPDHPASGSFCGSPALLELFQRKQLFFKSSRPPPKNISSKYRTHSFL
jgi:hypothetical protein